MELVAALQQEEKQLMDHLKLVRQLLARTKGITDEIQVIVKPEARVYRKIRRGTIADECIRALKVKNNLRAKEVFEIVSINNSPEKILAVSVYSVLSQLARHGMLNVDKTQSYYRYSLA